MERLYSALELRQPPTEDGRTFTGYASVFNVVDAYGDSIAPGAFQQTLEQARSTGNWPAMLQQHGLGGLFGGSAQDMMPLGLWTSIVEDQIGLKVEGMLAQTPRAEEAYALMKMRPRPAINGLSIGFFVKDFERGTKPDEPRRLIKKVDLMEISLVTFPANAKARVQEVRSQGDLPTIREMERYLVRDAGFTRSEAQTILCQGYKALLVQREADTGEDEEQQEFTDLLTSHRAQLEQLRATL